MALGIALHNPYSCLLLFSSPYMLQLTTRSIHTDAKLLKQRCSELVDRIIRVDQAGELGANQIYRGQLVILGKRITPGVATPNDCN